MTVIALSKILLLGCGGALGYYFIASYIFSYFPMPFFWSAKAFLEGWCLQHQAEQKKRTVFWWSIGNTILNIALLITWWLFFAGFAYLFYFVLHYYFSKAGELFWLYYVIGLALPTIWVLVYSVLFFRKKNMDDQTPTIDTRPLIEQVANS